MGTTFDGVDIVHIRMYVLAVVGIIHHSHLYGDVLFFCFEVDNIVEEVCAMAVYVAYKLFQAIFGMESLGASLTIFIRTKVGKCYLYASIKVCQFAHTRRNDVPTIHGCSEDAGVGPELLACSTLIRFANNLNGVHWFTCFVFLLVDFSITKHLRHHSRRQRIYATNAHAMESTAHFIRAFIKLTTCVQHRHNHFKGRLMQFFVFVNGDSTTVVLHCY